MDGSAMLAQDHPSAPGRQPTRSSSPPVEKYSTPLFTITPGPGDPLDLGGGIDSSLDDGAADSSLDDGAEGRGHGHGLVQRVYCAFPGCAKHYASQDGVRKHARQNHPLWLHNLDGAKKLCGTSTPQGTEGTHAPAAIAVKLCKRKNHSAGFLPQPATHHKTAQLYDDNGYDNDNDDNGLSYFAKMLTPLCLPVSLSALNLAGAPPSPIAMLPASFATIGAAPTANLNFGNSSFVGVSAANPNGLVQHGLSVANTNGLLVNSLGKGDGAEGTLKEQQQHGFLVTPNEKGTGGTSQQQQQQQNPKGLLANPNGEGTLQQQKQQQFGEGVRSYSKQKFRSATDLPSSPPCALAQTDITASCFVAADVPSMNQQDIANGKGMAAAEALSSQLRAAYLSQLSAVLSPPSPGHPQGAPDALQRALAFEAAAMAAGAFHATQAGLVQPPTGLPDLPGLMGPPRLPDSSRTFPNFPGLMCPPGLPDLELLPDSSGHPDSSRTFPDFPGLPDPELLPDSFGILPDTSRTPAALVAVNQTVAQQQPQQQPKPQQLQQPQQKQQEALGEQTLGEQTLAQQQQQQQSVEKQKLLQQTQGEPTPRTRTAGKRTLPQQPPILQQTLKMRTLAQGLRAGLENGSEGDGAMAVSPASVMAAAQLVILKQMQRCFDSEYLPQQQQQQPQQQNNDSQETQEAQQTTNNTSSLIFLHALKNAGSNLLADDKVPRVTSIHTLQRSDSLLTLHKVASALAVAPFAEGELEALFTDALSDASPVDDGFSDDDSSASPPPSPSSDQIEPYTIELDRTPGPPGPVKSTVPKRIPSSNTRMLPQAKRSKTAPAQPRGVWEEGGSGEEDSPGSDEALSGMKAPRQPALRAGESGREVAEFPDSQDVRMEANESGSRFPPGLEGSIWTSRC